MARIGSVYAKLEMYNPTGSIKDRVARHIMDEAERREEMHPGQRVLEVTSGNMGIALARIARERGYRFTAVMPEFISKEKQQAISSYGGEIVLTPAELDIAGAVEEYARIAEGDPNVFLPRQFQNPANVEAHRLTTGPEIIGQMKYRVDAVVAGIGTGGTLTGIALALKDAGIEARIIGVEPAESAVITGGIPGPHSIQGIGEGFIPEIVRARRELIDEVVRVSTEDAIQQVIRLKQEAGIFAGISSGANLLAARFEALTSERVVTVLPDSGERYISMLGNLSSMGP